MIEFFGIVDLRVTNSENAEKLLEKSIQLFGTFRFKKFRKS